MRPSALVDSELSTSRQTPLEHISGSGPARADWRPCSGRPAALLRRPFGAPVSCPRGVSSLRPTSARVGAFRTLRPTPLRLPPRLSADPQTARGQPRHRQGVRELWWTDKPSTSLTDAKKAPRPEPQGRRREMFGRFAPRRDSRPEWSSIGNSSHRGRWPVRCRCDCEGGGRRRRCR